MKIGAQLFTVREQCTTLPDFEDTLKKIAKIGYRYVQVSGVCEYDPAWLKEKLDENGLTCVLTHIPVDKLKADPAQVAADHDVFSCHNVGLGLYNFGENTPAQFAEELLPVARALTEHGKYFMFHNHYNEFKKDEDGGYYLDRLAQLFSSDELGFTFDTYWAAKSGQDPAQWLRKLSGRVPCIHLKDITDDEKMAVVGEGKIDFDAVFAAAAASGTEYMLVEQDDCYGEDPFDCLERSYRYLKMKGFE